VQIALAFLLCYGACLFAGRVCEMLDAGDELLRRAQGARRPFQLIDWRPGQ